MTFGAIVLLMLVGAAGGWFVARWALGLHPASRVRVGEVAAPVHGAVAPHAPASAYASRTIFRSWLRMYWRAGAEYGLDWTVLAAVGTLESDNGRSPLPGIRSGTSVAGVAGPAQFAEGTWARYSVKVDPPRRATRARTTPPTRSPRWLPT